MKSALEYCRKLPLPMKLLLLSLGVSIFVGFASVLLLILRKESIHYAARKGDVAELERILDAHPNWIENRNRLDLTPLLDATMEGQLESVQTLIRRGANVHAEWNLVASNDGRWTALHIAANWNRLSLIGVLAQSGVDVNAISTKGETAYDVALRGGHGELLDELHKHGGVSGDEVRKRGR